MCRRDPGVEGHRGRERRGLRCRLHQAPERREADVAFADRQEPETVGNVGRRLLQRRRQVAGALAARRVVGAVPSVAADLRIRRLRIPEEVTRRVDADHDRALDALRVPPGVDHRRAGADALADQVDPAVSERLASRFEVVDPLLEVVPGEVDAVRRQPVGARAEGLRVGAEGLRSEEVRRPLQRRHDLGAVETHRAVDAPVADEHDVVVVGNPARFAERHVRDTRTALQAEYGRARVRRAGADAGDRQRDQP